MSDTQPEKKSPLQEIVQPFVDLIHAPRALWGINLGYLIEGMVYFGMLGYLAMFFNDYVGLDDVWAGRMVGVLTAGITISMFFLGTVADRKGVRFAIVGAFVLMLAGRVLISIGPTIGLTPGGLGSPIHLLVMGGILLVIIGYGMYQPGAYAAVREFTTPKTAGMAFAMLYALMNLGGWLPSFFGFVRKAVGISGAFWVYTSLTAVALVATSIILSRKTVKEAIARAKAEREREEREAQSQQKEVICPNEQCGASNAPDAEFCATCGQRLKEEQAEEPVEKWNWDLASLKRWAVNHPLADAKFSYFIFCLIPVQTLFAHNWLTLPMYVDRAFHGTLIGDYFEFAVNLNPLLIFILVPMVTALTQRSNVYNMMILGTFVMAAPTFLLALGPTPWTLAGFLLIMTLGEAMWQPRFLQYAAEIAPKGRTGAYMGVAQLPWFLTKLLVPLYSGWFLQKYCPGPVKLPAIYPFFEETKLYWPPEFLNTQTMWFIYGCIAVTSTVFLILARGWLAKDFNAQHAKGR